MFNFKSVTIKLFFLFLLVGLIPLILVSYLSISSTKRGIKAEVLQGLKRYAEAKGEQIFIDLDFIEASGRYLADEEFLTYEIKKINSRADAAAGNSTEDGLSSYMVNREKKIFIYPRGIVLDRGITEALMVDSLPVKECLENNREIAANYKNHTGKEVLGASRCIADRGWIVVSELEADKAFLAVKEIYYQLVLMMIVSLLLVIGISLILAGKISEYLNKFVMVAKKVSKGDLNAQIEIDAKDEVGFVAKNFNKMITSLKISRDNIEKKVSERTRDLENINKYMVGREIRMIELKKKIEDLEKDGKI